jgi:hypothetical protein
VNTTSFLSLDNSSDTHSPAPHADTHEAPQFVGKTPEALSAMSVSELNVFIHDCAERMVAAQYRYEAHGDFADAGERDYYWDQEAAALRERGSRPAVVRGVTA